MTAPWSPPPLYRRCFGSAQDWGLSVTAAYGGAVDAELADALLESVGGDAGACAATLADFAATRVVRVGGHRTPPVIHVDSGDRLVFVDEANGPVYYYAVAPDDANAPDADAVCCFAAPHRCCVLRFDCDVVVIVETATRRYARAHDTAVDAYVHTGGALDAAARAAVAAVVEVVERGVRPWVESLAASGFMSACGDKADEVTLLLDFVRRDGAALAIAGGLDRAAPARFATAAHQLAMLYSALDGEAPCCLEFAAFLRNYDIARVNAAPAAKLAHVVERATELDAAIGAYVDALKREGPVHATEVARLERALPRLALAGASPAQVVDCFAELRPTALEAALRLLLDSAGSVHARSMPTIDVETLLGRADSGAAASLDGCIAHLAVALAGDHVLVGKGFDVSSALNVSSAPRDGAAADDAAENDAAVISALLGAGLSYSYSPAGLLLAQFASRRSVLRLRDSFFPAPSDHLRRSLRKRRSELVSRCLRRPRGLDRGAQARQLRARGECLSLRFDTVPFDDVLKLLRQNKDSCWVGGRCAAAWSALRLVGAFCVAELWQNDTLVACDFVHSSGRRCYVATRYAARAGAPKSPGFLLALLLACALGRRGFEVLDFGGVDNSPGPAVAHSDHGVGARPRVLDFGGVDASPELEYKLQLCDALDRALHLDCVRREDRAAPPPSLPPVGVLIHRIGAQHLFDIDDT